MKKVARGVAGLLVKVKTSLLVPGKRDNIHPEPEDIFHEIAPTGGLQGCLDFPQANAFSTNGTITVCGWLFSRGLRIESVTLATNSFPEEEIIYGMSRPDVGQAFPDVPNAGLSGFGWNLPIESGYSGTLDLRVWAILENGDRICCFARRVNVQATTQPKPREVNLNLFIRSVVIKGLKAAKKGKIPLSPVVWVKKIRRYYREIQGYQNPTVEPLSIIHPWQTQDLYQRWIETNTLTPKLLARLQEDANQLKTTGVTISLIVPLYNTPAKFLNELIESVTSQIYPNWELCLADDASTEKHVRKIVEQARKKDNRIKVIYRPQNGHIVEATNSALDLATGEYIALLDHDDLLPPDALLHVAECIRKHPDIDWIYTDEDKIDEDGRRYDPQMKGAWSPEMALTHNYTHHLAVFRRTLIEKIGRLRKGFEGAQDLDLFLRVGENTTPDKIRHVPRICYHWRCHSQSTASQGTQKRYVFDSAYRGIYEAIERRGLKAKPFLPAIAEKYGLCLYQLKWDDSLLAENPVTIAIPTRDKVELLEKCVSSLVTTVNSQFVKLIIIDDGSTEAKTHEYLKKLERDKVLQCRVIPSGRTDTPFNYARLMNLAAEHVDTPYMLHLNNDIEAIAPGWLEEMVGWMSIEGVGIVGAKLLYPDQTIQHSGVVVGSHNGLADHLFHGSSKDEVGYICLPHAARNLSAVTGACLLTSTALYKELGGFDEINFGVEYNDVDYCLRVMNSGKRIVQTPQALLIHQTSASRGDMYVAKEHLNFLIKYQDFRDPFFNENLDINSTGMAINPHHFCYADRVDKLKVLVITHNLNLEGATLIVHKYASYFATEGQYQVFVVSSQDGPLREAYERLNIPVKIIEESNYPLPEESLDKYRKRLKSLGNTLDLESFDLVICNTLISFWGVELANLFGLPSIWHLHESISIDRSINNFFSKASEEAMRTLLKDCLENASRVVFQANATRNIFHEFDVRGCFRTIPGGVDTDKITQFWRSHSKSELRAKHEIDENHTVITIVGTTCERKGQHIFLEAVNELKDIPNLSFLIVGAREETYLEYLRYLVRKLKLENVRMIHETLDVYDFFALSDIFVCASFEESFPRVILEAMAFKLKIVSTNVFGIPEIIRHRHEAYLLEPGSPTQLAATIRTCLDEVEFSTRLAENGYAKACREFDNNRLLQQHLLLTKEVALS